MEKVTKDLRRSPSTTSQGRGTPVDESPALQGPDPKPTPASAGPATPAPRTSSSVTTPPGRAIQRESQVTPERSPEPAMGGLDYGREIDLPDTIPPSAPPARQGAKGAPSSATSQPATRRAASVDTDAAVPSPKRMPNARPGGSNGATDSEPTVHVVPIQLPKGSTREIVLKIVISTEE
jgi:hypothetical protein